MNKSQNAVSCFNNGLKLFFDRGKYRGRIKQLNLNNVC